MFHHRGSISDTVSQIRSRSQIEQIMKCQSESQRCSNIELVHLQHRKQAGQKVLKQSVLSMQWEQPAAPAGTAFGLPHTMHHSPGQSNISPHDFSPNTSPSQIGGLAGVLANAMHSRQLQAAEAPTLDRRPSDVEQLERASLLQQIREAQQMMEAMQFAQSQQQHLDQYRSSLANSQQVSQSEADHVMAQQQHIRNVVDQVALMQEARAAQAQAAQIQAHAVQQQTLAIAQLMAQAQAQAQALQQSQAQASSIVAARAQLAQVQAAIALQQRQLPPQPPQLQIHYPGSAAMPTSQSLEAMQTPGGAFAMIPSPTAGNMEGQLLAGTMPRMPGSMSKSGVSGLSGGLDVGLRGGLSPSDFDFPISPQDNNDDTEKAAAAALKFKFGGMDHTDGHVPGNTDDKERNSVTGSSDSFSASKLPAWLRGIDNPCKKYTKSEQALDRDHPEFVARHRLEKPRQRRGHRDRDRDRHRDTGGGVGIDRRGETRGRVHSNGSDDYRSTIGTGGGAGRSRSRGERDRDRDRGDGIKSPPNRGRRKSVVSVNTGASDGTQASRNTNRSQSRSRQR